MHTFSLFFDFLLLFYLFITFLFSIFIKTSQIYVGFTRVLLYKTSQIMVPRVENDSGPSNRSQATFYYYEKNK